MKIKYLIPIFLLLFLCGQAWGQGDTLQPIQQVTDAGFNVRFHEWAEVDIGDRNVSYFKPQARLKRWGDECWMDVKWLTAEEIPPTLDVIEGKIKKVKWRNPDKVELQFYPVDGYGLGGFEIEVILKQKPDSNKIVFVIKTQGLSFHYQPPLTEEEISLGAIRPENVVGSYAVYHENKEAVYKTIEEAHKYKIGKAFHIYRPKVYDAEGDSIWAKLNVDKEKGYLTITIDEGWLNQATYPVTVDPTFGYETNGAGSITIEDQIVGTAYACGGSGDADSMYCYLGLWGAGEKVKLAVYLKSTKALVGGTEERTTGGNNAWYGFDMLSEPELSATDYGLLGWADNDVHMWYDAVSVYKYWKAGASYDGWPAPYDGTEGTGNYKYSIYCTYTEGAPPEVSTRRLQMLKIIKGK